MTPIVRQPGFAAATSIVDGLVYVAYGIKPDALILDVFTPTGALVKSVPLEGGFYDSFPAFSGRWLAYKRNTDWKTVAVNVVDGQMFTFGEADGNWPIAVNDALGLVAWQTGQSYAIQFGSLIDGTSQPSGQSGAPDGLSALMDTRLVTLRKDLRPSVPGIFYPVRARDLVVGEWIQGLGLGVQLDGDDLRVALIGQESPTPSGATDGQTYVMVTGGKLGVRVCIGSRADLLALPRAADIPIPAPPVPAIGRALAVGWLHFGSNPETAPGNCMLQIDPDGLLRDRATGQPLASYATATPDGDVDALDRAIAAAAALRPTLPVIAYWTAQAQKVRVPVAPAGVSLIVGPECYGHVGETPADSEMRFRLAVSMCPAAILIAQCYTSNANNIADVASLVPGYARIARDYRNVLGILGFSSGSRATGWDDQPDSVHDAWRALFASVSGLCAFPQPHIAPPPFVPPTPPKPPVPPVPPVPPAPPVPVLNGKDLNLMLLDPSKELIYAKSIDKHQSRSGLSVITLPTGRVFSCQPDGTPGDRDPGADGGYEACQMTGTLATFQPVPGKFYTFGVALVDAL